MTQMNTDEQERELTEEEKRQLMELQFRWNFCRLCIKTVSEVPADDPKREGALAEYNRQLSEIGKNIEAITGKAPTIVIGLKPGMLFAKGEGTTRAVTTEERSL